MDLYDGSIYGYIPFLINGDLKMEYIENPGSVEGDLALAFREGGPPEMGNL
jgi:hypothetical protein